MSKRFNKGNDTLLKKGELFKCDLHARVQHRDSFMKSNNECSKPMTKPRVNEENIEKRMPASCKFIVNHNEYMEELEKYIKTANDYIELLVDSSYDALMEYFEARRTRR